MLLLALVLLTGCSDDDKPKPSEPAPTLPEMIQTMLDQAVAADSIPGDMITVYRAGTIDWSGASGMATLEPARALEPDEPFRVGSITKMMAAVIALELVDENQLHLNDPIDDYLRPSLVDSLPHGEEITLRMLLNHTSGLADYTRSAELEAALLANPDRKWRPEELIGLALALEQPGLPGGEWHYASTNYVLLQLVLESKTGQTFSELLRARIALPLGLANTSLPSSSLLAGAHGYQDVDGDGRLDDITGLDPSYVGAAGGAVSTTRELVLFSRALFGHQLLSNTTQTAMTNAIDTGQLGVGYGLGLTVLLNAYYGHAGEVPGYTSGVFYIPVLDLTVALVLTKGGEESAGLALLQRVAGLFQTYDGEEGVLAPMPQSAARLSLLVRPAR